MRFKLTHNGEITEHFTLKQALDKVGKSKEMWSIWDKIENRVVLTNENM